MMPKIRRFVRLNQSLVTYAIVFVVAVLGLVIGLIPSLQKTIVLVRDIQTLGGEIASIQKKLNMLTSLDQAELEKQSFDVLSAVPMDKSVSTLLATVEAVAVKNGLTVSDLTIENIGNIASSSGKMKPEGNIMTEKVTLQGELLQIRNFLSECIKVRRLLRVSNLELTNVPQTSQMLARLSIEVFYAALPVTLGKASDTLQPFSIKEENTLSTIQSYPIAYAPSSVGAAFQTQTPGVVGVEPTSPVVLDPFFPINQPVSPTPKPTARPTQTIQPSPLPTPLSSPLPPPSSYHKK